MDDAALLQMTVAKHRWVTAQSTPLDEIYGRVSERRNSEHGLCSALWPTHLSRNS